MKRNLEPPHWVDYLIDNLSPHHLAEEIRGDLYEVYLKDAAAKGPRAASRSYIINGLGFLAKNFFWKKSSQNPSTSNTMIRNYFKMATRSLLAYKGTTTINILGLVVGIASALVIAFVIRYERSFDTFHSNRDQIYRIVRVSGSDMSEFRSGIAYPVPAALKAEIPALKNVASVEYFGGANLDVIGVDGSTIEKFREETQGAIARIRDRRLGLGHRAQGDQYGLP
jgi:hypothetical protein